MACRWALLVRGLWYSVTILAILGSHELGHYFACRYYDVDASLPYFLPAPLPLTGTLGRLHPDPRADSAASGCCSTSASPGRSPASSIAVPALFLGIAMSHVVRVAGRTSTGMELGEPLLFKAGVVADLGAHARTATR